MNLLVSPSYFIAFNDNNEDSLPSASETCNPEVLLPLQVFIQKLLLLPKRMQHIFFGSVPVTFLWKDHHPGLAT